MRAFTRELLRTYLAPQWRGTLLMSFLLLSSIGLQLLNPQLLQTFVDAALRGAPQEALISLGILFVLLALGTQVATIAATYVSEQVAWNATNRVREDLLAHCLTLDMSFHKAHTPGELIQRVDGDVDELASFFSRASIQLIGNLLLMLGIVLVLLREEWRLSLMMSGFIALASLLLTVLHRYGRPYWLENQVKQAEFFGLLGEHLEGTEELRANGASGFVIQRFYRCIREWWPIAYRGTVAGFLLFSGSVAIFSLGNIMVLAVGAALLSTHAISLGTVYMVFYYTNLIVLPLEQIRDQIQELQAAGVSIERIHQLFDTRSRLASTLQDTSADAPSRDRSKELSSGALEVTFDQVTFGYNADEPVLRDLNLHLPAGNVLGVLGRTGSGKTTLARLALRFYDPQSGDICLDGVPLREISLEQVRQRMTMVTQDVQLFQGTVRENLTLFKRHVSDARMIGVLSELGLERWLQNLPDGLESQLGAGGVGLSAGEAQLLAFARVFLEDSSLIVLDEASSRLDPATEQLIEGALERLLRGRTGIIIAHRLATVLRADAILILHDGRVLEYGSRMDLLADPHSHFSRLLAGSLWEVLL